ncbi:PAS domain-containing hybrid sensor histidine kinase/response regulator [Algihabitans albus]|uniref:PAS domain-containing hybrid sensor histidine kinase/response regulator n=1 Tax=Algihabitans albus TaxID=2164067 RepID=UPI000E5D6A90|nr:PAS domain-containing sensor histidine kinase [Algihabitans albus]
METLLIWQAVAGLAVSAALVAGVFLWRCREAQMRLRALLDTLPEPHQLLDAQGRILQANASCADFCDGRLRPLDAVLADRLAVTPTRLGGDSESSAEALARLATNARNGAGGTAELRLRGTASKPEEVWVEVSVWPAGMPRGALLWQVSDITTRRQMESTIQAEQRRLVDLFERAPIGFYSVDGQGRFRFVNQTLAEWLGRTAEDLVAGAALHDVLAEPPRPETPAYAPVAEADDQIEVKLRGCDGEVFDALIVQAVAADEEEGGALRTRSVVRHLTRERAAAEALADSERRFKRFFDEAPIAIVELDRGGRLRECNPAFETLLGLKGQDVIGQPLGRWVAEDERTLLRETLVASSTGPGQSADLRLRGVRELLCTLSVSVIDDGAGKPGGFVCHLLDTTEQKALEVQFAQSQKMQAVGQLAGGIAHDFNNLLTAMIGFSDLLLLRHRPGDQSFADIMQIKQNANRAANLVRQLLAFSRQQTLQPRMLNVTDILAELSHLLRRLIGETIELDMVHGRDLGQVRADQGQLEQVIINLAVNARDAMSGGGRLIIRTYNAAFETPQRRKGEEVAAGDYVVIEVSDSGCGISQANLDRIFDPFFSTKEVGEGTGLGLSTVYGIVKQTGGFIVVDSELDTGTTFTIYLPRHLRRGEPVVEPEVRDARDLTGIGSVLLVEDEDAVRSFSARALRNKGYEVHEARSGEAALDMLRNDGNLAELDLLVTDVVMPRLDGPSLVREVRQDRPKLKVIFISGYAEDSFRQRVGEEEGIHFLPKPFTLKQLAGKVKEVMGEGSA